MYSVGGAINATNPTPKVQNTNRGMVGAQGFEPWTYAVSPIRR
jgi:hypothetical protein